MLSFRSLRLALSAGALAFAAIVAASVFAPEARAEPPCQSWTGRLCAKTEVCTGDYIKQCTSYFYYFGTAAVE